MVGLEDDAAVAGRNALWTVPEPEVMDMEVERTQRGPFSRLVWTPETEERGC